MVLGAARHMGGWDDALLTALVLPAAVFPFAQPLPFALTAPPALLIAVYIFVSLIKLPPSPSTIRRNAVACVLAHVGEENRGDELRKP